MQRRWGRGMVAGGRGLVAYEVHLPGIAIFHKFEIFQNHGDR